MALPAAESVTWGLELVQLRVVLSDEFYQDITAHPIPTDLAAVRVLSAPPATLDPFMWLSYRFSAKAEEEVPIFGWRGLAAQLGNVECGIQWAAPVPAESGGIA